MTLPTTSPESPAADPMRIAIVGGGVSGLSTAYYLAGRARRLGRRLDIHVYEAKETLGGNADTVVVDLGRVMGANGPGERYLRWADLGVNDANLATYRRMEQVMRDIGYLQNMLPLQDSACFDDRTGRVALTDDAAMKGGVSDPRYSLVDADSGRLWPLIRVVHQTALDLLGDIHPDYTCARYFQDCLDDPPNMLAPAARALGIAIDWGDPTLGERLVQVRDHYYYPRISAMYFTDPRGPAGMPLQSPFEYYQLQEGGGTPHRCYFDHGAQTWIEALARHVEGSADGVTVSIHACAPVRVRVDAHAAVVKCGDDLVTYDLVVMANHADDAAMALTFESDAAAFGQRIEGILGSVAYTHGYAVCHTGAARLPANRNSWRTYNIEIRARGACSFPYRIDYVANLHQNDPANPAFDRAGLPVYFVSLVDDLNAIPRDEILDRVTDLESLPPALRDALPHATRAHRPGAATGYRHQMPHPPVDPVLNAKAWTMFKHNVLDEPCLQAQEAILAVNEAFARTVLDAGPAPTRAAAVPPLLFGGGWTLGAGLQEQCLQQSERIAAWILPD